MSEPNPPAGESVNVRLKFPEVPTRVPVFANSSIINVVNTDVMLEFGFADPYLFGAFQREAQANPDAVLPVAPVARVTMGIVTAKELLENLRNAIRQGGYDPDAKGIV